MCGLMRRLLRVLEAVWGICSELAATGDDLLKSARGFVFAIFTARSDFTTRYFQQHFSSFRFIYTPLCTSPRCLSSILIALSFLPFASTASSSSRRYYAAPYSHSHMGDAAHHVVPSRPRTPALAPPATPSIQSRLRCSIPLTLLQPTQTAFRPLASASRRTTALRSLLLVK